MNINIFWFRRDIRLEDNTALLNALNSRLPTMPIFIFDLQIIEDLPRDDARVNFIYNTLSDINAKLNSMGSSIHIYKGKPLDIWENIISSYDVKGVYLNKDYEPYAKERDRQIEHLLRAHGIGFHAYKDHVVFEENEILKADGLPYTIFTPYKNKWKERYKKEKIATNPFRKANFYPTLFPFPSLSEIGFLHSAIKVKKFDLSNLEHYAATRDIPSKDTTHLGPHMRFGTVSIRQIISLLNSSHDVFLNELIWREFFSQILHHFPKVVHSNFNSKYDGIKWINDPKDFERWCNGTTGYPLVDAGMRQLNETGFMHNRVRMVVAGFLCKHLLIDWQWGEAYFADKLLDFELASNNGNWQWAAGTGCDAAPYFRIFNPWEQLRKFDGQLEYVKKWVPEYGTSKYPEPMIDHVFARQRALKTYKTALYGF